MEEQLVTLVSSYLALHDCLLNVCRDIIKENEGWKEAAEIIGTAGECT